MSAEHDYGPEDYDEWVDCWQCSGEGGWNSCMEDTCCALGGEEGCDDPLCWRRCGICRGKGGWPREETNVTTPDGAQQKAGDAGK